MSGPPPATETTTKSNSHQPITTQNFLLTCLCAKSSQTRGCRWIGMRCKGKGEKKGKNVNHFMNAIVPHTHTHTRTHTHTHTHTPSVSAVWELSCSTKTYGAFELAHTHTPTQDHQHRVLTPIQHTPVINTNLQDH